MAGKDDRVDNAEIRNWIAEQVHTADCRCKLCWTPKLKASGISRAAPGGDVARKRVELGEARNR